jgi:alpha-mannosidase
MQKHRQLTLERIQAFKETILSWVYPQRAELQLSVYSAPGRITYTEALQGDYQPAIIGQIFGPAWSTHWFHLQAQPPKEWRGKEIYLLWNSSSEALVWQSGVPLQGLTGYEDGWKRPIRCAFRLDRSFKADHLIEVYIEMACNRLFGVDAEDQYILRQAEIALFDPLAWDLLWDYTVVADLARHLPPETPRAGQALYAANQMINLLRQDDPQTWQQARSIAAGFLAARAGEGQHHISAVGHAHIDTAWLWPLAETRRKCARTFSSVLRMMEDYPEYKFASPQAQQYAWMKAEYPILYQQIKHRVEKGRFIPVGGTWVEPDCNLPSGESLARQFLYGQRFFRKEFGQFCREFWNPDVFGYSAALPQIMRQAGIEYFLTQKLSWNQFNKPANQTFIWQGLDGSQVLTHFPPADTYNSRADVEEVLHEISNFKEHDRANESLMLFGYGDGGGGPTPEMLEQLRRMRFEGQPVDGLPDVQIRSPQEFFTRCADDIKHPATWVGELYFELHRGTYTSQAANKRDNRRAEFTLHEAEFLSALAFATSQRDYPSAELERLWKLTLTNQFHDILPGSSIREVYEDSARDYQEILESANLVSQAALQALFPEEPGPNVLLFNTLSAPRREVLELPWDQETAQQSANGRPLALLEAPALGYAVQTTSHPASHPPVSARHEHEQFILENSFIRAVFTPGGQLTSLYDKRLNREAIAAGRTANQFVLYDDHPNQWDAWDVDIFHLEKFDLPAPAFSAEIIENGPLRAALRFEYQLSPRSRLQQTVLLACHSARLDFECQVDWYESQRFLKVEFPLEISASQATYEIQFGHVQRPTHFNTTWDLARFEVCAHRWADLSEPGFGVALLNDSKYGYACHGNVLRLSLLRATTSPDPQADRGQHHFRYALLPHAGDFRTAGVIAEGYRFNLPPRLLPTNRPPEKHSFFELSEEHVVLETLKKAEDTNSLILRLYEAHGRRGAFNLQSAPPIRAAALCNLLEEEQTELSTETAGTLRIEITPFQLQTVRLDL